MSAKQPAEVSTRKAAPHLAQPDPSAQKTSRATDRSRTGEGSGASGGGSIGNLPGAPVTGGSPEFGPKEMRPEGPAADQPPRERKHEER